MSRRTDRELARQLVDEMSDVAVERLAKQVGKSCKYVREYLESMARHEPVKVILALGVKA